MTPESGPVSIASRDQPPLERLTTGIGECDRVLGGGVVPGALVLLGGDPGIGKSTLMLQLCHRLATDYGPVLYVSGEESFAQTQLRARRLGTVCDDLMLLTEIEVGRVAAQVEQGSWSCVVVDSIQSVYSADLSSVPGSVGQVRECANEFLRLAKGRSVPIFLVGHVTKEGSLAGPRLLEHLVDAVLYFEGDGKQALRILRAVKNRFGSTNEIGVFEMGDVGLSEVPNPSALFLTERPRGVSGSVVFPSMEGTRPVLVEVQALVGEPGQGTPRRAVAGVNPNRVSLILAVLEKRAGLHLGDRDIFVNVAGGVRLEEPAVDLAVAVALASSFREVPVDPGLAVFGEIGLAGEVRAVSRAAQRIGEAAKFGFTRCLMPKAAAADSQGELECAPVAGLNQAVEWSLEG
jgi:DNA repair protein RadA/Sms